MADTLIRHKDTCMGALLNTERGRLGDMLSRCRNCGRFAVVTPGPATPALVAPTPAAKPAPVVQPARVLTVPPSGYLARHGDCWPTHKAKARRKPTAVR